MSSAMRTDTLSRILLPLVLLIMIAGCRVYHPSPPLEQYTQETLGEFLFEGTWIKVQTTSDKVFRLKLTSLEETYLLGEGASGTIKIPYHLIENIEKGEENEYATYILFELMLNILWVACCY